jgi:hypothetical protein
MALKKVNLRQSISLPHNTIGQGRFTVADDVVTRQNLQALSYDEQKEGIDDF